MKAHRLTLPFKGLLAVLVLALGSTSALADGQERKKRKLKDRSVVERQVGEPLVIQAPRFIDQRSPSHWRQIHERPRYAHRHRQFVPPRAIRRKLRHRGMRQISDVQFRGGRYHVRATGPRGARLKLVFHARSGELLRVKILRGPSWRGPVMYNQYRW